MNELVLDPDLFADLMQSSEWYELERAGLGIELMSEVASTIDQVFASPMRFPRVDGELRRAQVHRFPFGVFYVTKGEAIIVFAVLHLKRSSSEWKGRAPRS